MSESDPAPETDAEAPQFVGMQLDPEKSIPITAHVAAGDEHHKYKFQYADPDHDRAEPGVLSWSGQYVDFLDVPDEWLEAAKTGIETYTRYEVSL